MPIKNNNKDLFKAQLRRKRPGKKAFIRKTAFAFAKSEAQAKRFIKRRNPGFEIIRIKIN